LKLCSRLAILVKSSGFGLLINGCDLNKIPRNGITKANENKLNMVDKILNRIFSPA
jgi:hypothetical protein